MLFLAGWMGTMLLAVTRILNVVLEAQSTGQTLAIIAVVGILATGYTALGGVKAVIWTDTIQTVVLMGGALLAICLPIRPAKAEEPFRLKSPSSPWPTAS